METRKISVNLELPEHYFAFWEELRRIYGLPEDALNRVATEQVISYLNLMHDDLAAQPVLDSGDIREELSLKRRL